MLSLTPKRSFISAAATVALIAGPLLIAAPALAAGTTAEPTRIAVVHVLPAADPSPTEPPLVGEQLTTLSVPGVEQGVSGPAVKGTVVKSERVGFAGPWWLWTAIAVAAAFLLAPSIIMSRRRQQQEL